MTLVQDWNCGWTFRRGTWNETEPSIIREGESVTLPHTWYADGDYYQGEGIYQKCFSMTPDGGHRIYLRFHGVDKVCCIYLNGTLIGSHKGGYTIFAVELTDALAAGNNVLTVLVSNEKGHAVSPLSGDFAVFGGIHRAVEMLITEKTCFDRTWFGTDGLLFSTETTAAGQGTLHAEAHLSVPAGQAHPKAIHLLLRDSEGRVCAEATVTPDPASHICCADLSAGNVNLWNGLGQANLYTASAELLSGDGLVIDHVSKHVGFRHYQVLPDRGFFLNGVHTPLHGVAKHQDSAGVFSACTEKEWEKDMELIGELGANAVRLSHYPHPQPLLDRADAMGLVVWSEIPMLKMTPAKDFMDNAKNQLTEMILQNIHHPSICFWGLQNEIAIFGEAPYMKPQLEELRELAHRLDPTRLTTSSNLNSVPSESVLNRITDVTAYNVYYGWYYGTFDDTAAFLDDFHRVNPQMPLGISEYGADCSTAFHSDAPAVNDYTEEFQARYHETVYPMMASRDFVWGTFVWNMFDFVSPIRHSANIDNRNLKGLVTFDRKTRKEAFYYYKAQWSKKPFVHICGSRFTNRASEAIDVKVYSNQPAVTLTYGGTSATQTSENGVFVFHNVPLTEGENLFRATATAASASEVSDEIVFVRVAEPDPSYVFVDQTPGLHVANWFCDEQEEARLFPEGRYSIRQKIETLRSNEQVLAIIDAAMPDVGADLRDTIGSFTLEQYFSHQRPPYTDEQIKELNAQLTQILM